jgi:hypothetical protein
MLLACVVDIRETYARESIFNTSLKQNMGEKNTYLYMYKMIPRMQFYIHA